MKLILPFPPSVNTYWRHPNKGAFAGKSLISEAGRKFQSAACAAIVEQLRRLPACTSVLRSLAILLLLIISTLQGRLVSPQNREEHLR